MSQPALPPNQLLEPRIPPNLSVKVIGLGGVGGPVARYLAVFLASQRVASRLVLIDGDSFEPSNASRMIFGNCGNKAAVLHAELLQRISESPLTLLAIEDYVTADNINRLIHEDDVVILAVDNHATRKLVNDYCAAQLRNVCRTTIVRDAWQRGQPLAVHACIYHVEDGLLHDLGLTVAGLDDLRD